MRIDKLYDCFAPCVRVKHDGEIVVWIYRYKITIFGLRKWLKKY